MREEIDVVFLIDHSPQVLLKANEMNNWNKLTCIRNSNSQEIEQVAIY